MIFNKAAWALQNLPKTSIKKAVWPWIEEIESLPEYAMNKSSWPKISIVTPSYNQGQFLEETIRSVLLQGYPNLEYIIIDGGSTDNSIEIIKKYESCISYWVSEQDRGQSHALNKGFRLATGELVGWQNSDDIYSPDIFRLAALFSNSHQEIDVLYGSTNYIDETSKLIGQYPVTAFNIAELMPYPNICNQAMFFKRRIFDEGNFIDESFQHAMDTEFFIRLGIKGYQFEFFPEMMGCYRIHAETKRHYQVDTCILDSLRIYKAVFDNKELPSALREKALASFQSMCIDQFGKMRIDLFRQCVHRLFEMGGVKALNPEILAKYLICLSGAKNVEMLKTIYRSLKTGA